ncbi:hypothetical protein [Nostoc sp. FACHB-110]|nr:hypothetical protein [Nostoc sp. FACHB-110]MBD2440181.1 hypothetical protein [Nostoc sp. FACHB-110]
MRECWVPFLHPTYTSLPVPAIRRRIRRDLDLPMKDEYSLFIRQLITAPI